MARHTPMEARFQRGVSAPTPYERRQQFNRVTSWLHSHRYRHIHRVFARIAAEVGDRPIRVIDVGCGYAKLFDAVNGKFRVEYAGIELNAERAGVARRRYRHHDNFSIIHDSATDALMELSEDRVDVVASLETLEHIPEHEVVRIVERIAELRPRVFVCSVPVEIGPAIWLKNVGSFLAGYVRHREYTWRETFWAGLCCLDRLPPHGTRHKGFDWRWLAQTVRHSFAIEAIHGLPLDVLPPAFSTNVLLVAEPRSVSRRPVAERDFVAGLVESLESASSREIVEEPEETAV